MDVHHLDRDPANNKWDNLLLCPKWVHKYAEFINSYWININSKMVQKSPYDIMDLTGLTLEEIVYPVRRDPDVYSRQDGHDLEIYCISDWYIGYELDDPNFRQMLLERGHHLGKSRKKKKKAEQE